MTSMEFTRSMHLAAQDSGSLQSLLEILQRGGYMIWPIIGCSVIGLAFAIERWLRLRSGALGEKRLAGRIVEAIESGGAKAGLDACEPQKGKPLARILRAGIERAESPYLDREHAIGDAASHEMKRLAANLRPLLIVWLIAPLLGLLGTVWGMIEAFSQIADGAGMGKPELLANGIYQALTTTAAGLAVAIPAIVVYHLLRGRIEKFARRVELSARDVQNALDAGRRSLEA